MIKRLNVLFGGSVKKPVSAGQVSRLRTYYIFIDQLSSLYDSIPLSTVSADFMNNLPYLAELSQTMGRMVPRLRAIFSE